MARSHRHGYSRLSKRDIQVNHDEIRRIEAEGRILEKTVEAIIKLVEAGKRLEKEGIWRDGMSDKDDSS